MSGVTGAYTRATGTGFPEWWRRQRLNCDRWQGDSRTWFVDWMQSLPGADNGLTFAGRPLSNWWVFVGDFDRAMRRGRKLVETGPAGR